MSNTLELLQVAGSVHLVGVVPMAVIAYKTGREETLSKLRRRYEAEGLNNGKGHHEIASIAYISAEEEYVNAHRRSLLVSSFVAGAFWEVLVTLWLLVKIGGTTDKHKGGRDE